MCRSADIHLLARDKINIKAFSVQLTLSTCTNTKLIPDSLTLVYLPRIITGTVIDIDGSKIRPDSPAFVTLYRIVKSGDKAKTVSYVSKERVRAGEGVRYEVCMGDVKLLHGGFQRVEDDEDGSEWGMGLRCLLEEEVMGLGLVEAEVCVEAEGRVMVCEKVEMEVRKGRRRRRKVMGLEEIPEGKEEECGSCCCGEEVEVVAEESGGGGEVVVADMEGVGWAVDVGFWVMCLGVGILVSTATSRRFRRRKLC